MAPPKGTVPINRTQPERAAQVVAAYMEGATIPNIARTFHMGRSPVVRELRAAGVTRHRRDYPPSIPAAKYADSVYATLYQRGLGLRLIAKQLGVSPSLVVKKLDKAGIPRRPGNVRLHPQNRIYPRFNDGTAHQAFLRDNGRCRDCGKSFEHYRQATYHHIKQVALGGDNSLENCMTLCPACHEADGYRRWHKLVHILTE